MSIGAQPRVIGKVPAVVVWIGIDHDIVAIPEPAAGIVVVIWRNLKEKAAHVETIPVATTEPPNVLRADATCEVSVLPGMVEMVVRIIAPAIVAYPLIILRVDVWRFRMARLILESLALISLLRSRTPIRFVWLTAM